MAMMVRKRKAKVFCGECRFYEPRNTRFTAVQCLCKDKTKDTFEEKAVPVQIIPWEENKKNNCRYYKDKVTK